MLRPMCLPLLALAQPISAFAQDVITFDDGYRAVLYPMPGARTVAVRTAFARGWGSDPDDLPGAAHLVEHLWFRARLAPGQSPLFGTFEAEGCRANGFTSPDRTTFLTTCPADSLPLLLDAHAALAADPLVGIGPDELAIENRVVRFEEAEAETWARLAQRAMLHRLLPDDHPAHVTWAPPDLRRSPAGFDAVTAWAAQAHSPDQASLIVAGAFNADEVRAALERRHGAIRSSAPREVRTPSIAAPPAPPTPQGPALSLPAPTPVLYFGWTLPTATPSAAGSALADQIASTLAQELEEDAEVPSVGCGYDGMNDVGVLMCQVVLSADGGEGATVRELTSKVEDAVVEALDGPGRREAAKGLAEDKRRLETALRNLDRLPEAVAERLEEDLLRLGAPRSPERLIEDLRAWQPKPAVHAAARWVTPARMARLQVEPASEGIFLLDDPPMRPVRAAPEPRSVDRITLEDAEAAETTLDNGLRIVAVREPQAVRTLASLRFGGGADRFPTGLSWIAERMTGSPDARARPGITPGEGGGLDHTELYVWADPGREELALRQLRKVAVRRFPGFSDEKRERLDGIIDRTLALRRAVAAEPAVRAAKDLLDAVAPGHGPSRGPSDDDLRAMRQLDPGAMVAYLNQTYQPANAVLTLTGPHAPPTLIALATASFATWQARPGVAAGRPLLASRAGPPVPITAFYEDPRASTAHVTWMCRLPDGTGPGPARVLEGLLQRRAWVALRSQAGLTYTPSVDALTWPDGTAILGLSVGTRAREAAATLDTITSLLAAPGVDETARARTRTLRRFMGARDSQVTTEAAVFAAVADGRDPTAPFAALRASVDNTDAKRLTDLLTHCVDTRSWVVTGPPLAGASLREASHRAEAR